MKYDPTSASPGLAMLSPSSSWSSSMSQPDVSSSTSTPASAMEGSAPCKSK